MKPWSSPQSKAFPCDHRSVKGCFRSSGWQWKKAMSLPAFVCSLRIVDRTGSRAIAAASAAQRGSLYVTEPSAAIAYVGGLGGKKANLFCSFSIPPLEHA